MQVYLLMDGLSFNVIAGYLTKGEAERQRRKSEDFVLDVPLKVESPMELVNRYFAFRGLEMPSDSFHALAFLMSEVGELSDALVSSAGNWTRNNPDRERDPEMEAADVLMMLYVTMRNQGIDPLEAMLKKFQQKGFTDENPPDLDDEEGW